MVNIICVVDDVAKKDSNLQNEHGLTFWIETGQGRLIFDTGQTEAVLSHNLRLLGLRLEDADALALSHAHYDHTGGLEAILSKNAGLPLYAHTDIFQPRYSLRKGEYQSIGLLVTRKALASRAALHLSSAPVEIFPGLWTTGEIFERPEPEGRSVHHFIRTAEGWQPDPYRDDLSLALKTQAGLVINCGCCHAGLLNTLFHVERTFNQPIAAIIGGTHLVTADDLYLGHVIDVLSERYKSLHYCLNHCTGEHAYHMLARSFGSRVMTFPAGTVITFDS